MSLPVSPYHHPVLRMHKVDRAPGLLLHGGVDNAASDTVNEEDANKGALVVDIRALRHHSQQVGVQTLVEHASIPHHPALGVHVLTAALPLHLDNPLHFWGDGQLPTQFCSEILGRSKSACDTELDQGPSEARSSWPSLRCDSGGLNAGGTRNRLSSGDMVTGKAVKCFPSLIPRPR